MELMHEKGVKKGAFRVKDKGQIIAEMTYVRSSDDIFIIDHTEVCTKYQGQGLGKLMVESAVEFARASDMTILPLCPFARREFNQHPSYNDVRESDMTS